MQMRKPRSAVALSDRDDVTASEIACFAYCAKAWHLEHVLQVVPADEVMQRRERGVTAHNVHGQRVRLLDTLARRRIALMTGFLLFALVAAIAALMV